jgi:hypothetical protein
MNKNDEDATITAIARIIESKGYLPLGDHAYDTLIGIDPMGDLIIHDYARGIRGYDPLITACLTLIDHYEDECPFC